LNINHLPGGKIRIGLKQFKAIPNIGKDILTNRFLNIRNIRMQNKRFKIAVLNQWC